MRALASAKERKDNFTGGTAALPLRSGTAVRLDEAYTDYKALLRTKSQAETNQAVQSAQNDQAKATAKTWVSHYLQVLNLGVQRGIYDASHRLLYSLDVSSNALPELTKEDDILTWCRNIKTGEEDRVSRGGAPMSNPTADEVEVHHQVFRTTNGQMSNFKLDLENAQREVNDVRARVDKVIKKVWDELAAYYDEDDNATMREKCREWGVVFVGVVSNELVIEALDTDTGLPIPHFLLTVAETGDEHSVDTGAEGEFAICIG